MVVLGFGVVFGTMGLDVTRYAFEVDGAVEEYGLLKCSSLLQKSFLCIESIPFRCFRDCVFEVSETVPVHIAFFFFFVLLVFLFFAFFGFGINAILFGRFLFVVPRCLLVILLSCNTGATGFVVFGFDCWEADSESESDELSSNKLLKYALGNFLFSLFSNIVSSVSVVLSNMCFDFGNTVMHI